MIKILTVIGARPQIIKASAISRAVLNHPSLINEIIVHTGQHYDKNMSSVFFDELGIPSPKYNLNVGSDKHGIQTAKMIQGIEDIIEKEKPNYLLVYGDTNSTLSGAIAASKVYVPIVHIEAGLRSFNKKMPEEINRILTDHCSTYLFPPTNTSLQNLKKEGFNEKNIPPYDVDNPFVENCGDVMFDNTLYFSDIADDESSILNDLNLEKNSFVLCTIHRNDNTDNAQNLYNIIYALLLIIEKHDLQIVIPLHPRTRNRLKDIYDSLITKFFNNPKVTIVDPVSFFDMIILEKYSKFIITDSGGVQKEAYFFNKQCIILRKETEWIEIVQAGMAYITGTKIENILEKCELILYQKNVSQVHNIFGNGDSANRIIEKLL